MTVWLWLAGAAVIALGMIPIVLLYYAGIATETRAMVADIHRELLVRQAWRLGPVREPEPREAAEDAVRHMAETMAGAPVEEWEQDA